MATFTVDAAAHELVVTAQATMPDGWNDLVADDPDTEFFHTGLWTEAVAEFIPGYRPLWLTARRRDRLVGGLAAIVSDVPHGPLLRMQHIESHLQGTAGGPVLATDLQPDERRQVILALSNTLRKAATGPLATVAMVLGSGHEATLRTSLVETGIWHRRDDFTSAIPLAGGLEHVEMQVMAKNKRNERNRGLKRGAEFVITREADDLAGFYLLYEAASGVWRRPPVPKVFLAHLLAEGGGAAFLTCVKVDSRVVGGHFNLHHGRRVTSWLGATDPELARTHFPATVAVWGDLVESCARGAEWLDLGGSGGIASLSSFKKYLGAEVQPRGIYLYDSIGVRWLRRAAEVFERLTGRHRDRAGERVHDDPDHGGGDR